MSLKEERDQNVDVISYCESTVCYGVPMKVSSKEINEKSVCAVCYEPLKVEKVVRFNKCKHLLCELCAGDADGKICLKCEQSYDKMLTLSRPVESEIDWVIFTENHRQCIFNDMNQIVKEYFAELNGVWMSLVEFMFTATHHSEVYIGIKGIECLNLSQYEDEGRVLEKGKCHAVLKTAEDKMQVLFSCLLPCMSIRLLISPNEDIDIDEDDAYADEAVGFINKQLKACWNAFARLVNKDFLDHILVRKFRNVTCSVLLSGLDDRKLTADQDAPMKEHLGSLKEHNFSASHFRSIRMRFPILHRNSLDSQEYGGCTVFEGFRIDDSDDEYEVESGIEDDSDEDVIEYKMKEPNEEPEEDEKVDEADNDDEYFTRLN